ncbi:MAG: GGDEF domain-containing protein [Rhodocyclaceae bacterium]|nr:GGDEF domain-containing protein [Rhodocyclaceae bacterium]
MARATLRIFGLSAVVGLLVVLASARLLEGYEQERLVDNLGDLISAVERTASVAAFANDPQLASEVATGLIQNTAVLSARIYSGNALLAGSDNGRSAAPSASLDTITRPLHSPFDATETIGRIEIEPARARIRDEASRYATLVGMLLAMLVVLVAGVVAWVVYRSITRPIKTVADGLHTLDVQNGQQLRPPAGSEDDEIGRLVRNVNALVARIGEALETERALREDREQSERRFRMIFENAETGIFVVDGDRYLQSWNPAMVRLLGSERFQQAGMPPRLDLLLGVPAQDLEHLADQARSQNAGRGEDFHLSGPDAPTERWVHVVLNALGDGPMYGVANDITERRRAIATVLSLAERDPLTGVFNRRGMQRLASRVLQSADERRRVAVLMVDLDGFKAVNDSHGHEAGDKLLVQISQRLESLLRKSDYVARLGGDEFAVILTGLAAPEAATRIAAKLVDACAEAVPIGDVVLRVSASVGVAVSATADDVFEILLGQADQAMYEAKRGGKSAYRLYQAA